MSNKSFARAMNEIAAQAEAEQLSELKAQNRQRIYAKARSTLAFLLWTALLGCGIYYRKELQKFASEKFLDKPKAAQVDEATGKSLNTIQAQAKKRDQVVDEITK
jgi:hypothetical protein